MLGAPKKTRHEAGLEQKEGSTPSGVETTY
jgi:hypothetical protein